MAASQSMYLFVKACFFLSILTEKHALAQGKYFYEVIRI